LLQQSTDQHNGLIHHEYAFDISWNMELFDAFAEFFEEKARLKKQIEVLD